MSRRPKRFLILAARMMGGVGFLVLAPLAYVVWIIWDFSAPNYELIQEVRAGEATVQLVKGLGNATADFSWQVHVKRPWQPDCAAWVAQEVRPPSKLKIEVRGDAIIVNTVGAFNELRRNPCGFRRLEIVPVAEPP